MINDELKYLCYYRANNFGRLFMSTQQQELAKLLVLKKQQEELLVLDQADRIEKMKLECRHRLFLEMSSQQMEAELNKKEAVQHVVIHSLVIDPIVEDYKNLYSKETWYKEPEVSADQTTLNFPSQDTLVSFFNEQAQIKRSFTLIDKNSNKVLAYSNGDGTLYHGNGDAYISGHFQPSDKKVEDFKVPEREHRGPGMMP
jgi:hypothetical protein